MDGQALPVSPTDLYRHLGTAKAPLLIDVRRAPAFDADDRRIIGATRRLPDDLAGWSNALPKGRAVGYDALYSWCRMKVDGKGPH